MASFKTSLVASRLKSKGFTEERKGRDHIYFFFFYKGKKTGIYTKISHSMKEIGDSLIGDMKNQMKLSTKQFNEFVECTLGKEEYTKILLDNGYIKDKGLQ